MGSITLELVSHDPFCAPTASRETISTAEIKYLFRSCGDTLVLGLADDDSGVTEGAIDPTVYRFTTTDDSVIGRLKQAGAELVEVRLATCRADDRVNGIGAFVNRAMIKDVREMPEVYAHSVIKFKDGTSVIAVEPTEKLRPRLVPACAYALS